MSLSIYYGHQLINMVFEILVFLLLGVLVGVAFGLLPGVHPNMIILAIPLLSSLSFETPVLLVLVTAIAVANSITSFLPSILLGVPDSGNELSILPGQRMLMNGHGYQAIKLTVIGGMGAVMLCVLMFPLLSAAIPFLFFAASDFIYVLLLSIATMMILTEEKKHAALALFLVSGAIGIMSSRLPIDNTLVLFPVFSGFFGVSVLVLQLHNRTEIPEQHARESYVSKRMINRSVISGTMGGIFSGLLPGVGASEVAALANIDRDERAFLIRLGAITVTNIILSIVGLWLINKSRSGLAVVVSQLASVGVIEVLMVLAAAMASAGIASLLTIAVAKSGLSLMRNLGQKTISVCVLIFIIALTALFSGWTGMLLLVLCSAIGMVTNFSRVKRGILMGVLMVPTIIFYLS